MLHSSDFPSYISSHFLLSLLLEIFPIHSLNVGSLVQMPFINSLFAFLKSYCINSHGFKDHPLATFVKIVSLDQLTLQCPKLIGLPTQELHLCLFWFLKWKQTHIELTTFPPQNYSSSNVFNLHEWLYHSLPLEPWEASSTFSPLSNHSHPSQCNWRGLLNCTPSKSSAPVLFSPPPLLLSSSPAHHILLRL